MAELPDLFPGFQAAMIEGEGATIHCRIGGSGPPLLLLHGFPETHAMWHRVAPSLAKRFTTVVADLRGYGASSIPNVEAHPDAFSKRAMAGDMIAVMRRLGHDRFALVGHDRGARVAYRLALDTPEALTRLAVLDILPTFDYWRTLDRRFGLRIYHWLFLAQPAPLPERLINAEPDFFLERQMSRPPVGRAIFDPVAWTHYTRQMRDPARVAAMCEDYRAGARVDYDHDAVDRQAGARIAVPVLALWGARGIPSETENALEVWRSWADEVTGGPVDSGHYLAEEAPEATLAALLPFLAGA